mgnify:CR=1 FL=1
MTPEQREAAWTANAEQHRIQYESMTPEQRELRRIARADNYASLTPEQREARQIADTEWHRDHREEEREAIRLDFGMSIEEVLLILDNLEDPDAFFKDLQWRIISSHL